MLQELLCIKTYDSDEQMQAHELNEPNEVMYYFTESNILFNFSQCDPEKLTKYMMTAQNRTTITRPLNISID